MKQRQPLRLRSRPLSPRLLAILTCLVVAIAGCRNGNDSGQAEPGPVSENEMNGCAAEPDWFPVTARPAADSFPNSQNCDFHQWAWQTFLWLTQPSDPNDVGSPVNFAIMAYPRDLFTRGGTGPTQEYPGRSIDGGEPQNLLARVGKSQVTVDSIDIFQAGPGNKILIDQEGWVVYYSTYLDENYWDFAVENQLYVLDTLQNVTPDGDFPNDVLELKASWRVAEILDEETGAVTQTVIPDAGVRFFTTTAMLSPVVVKDGKVEEDPDPGAQQLATIALVGMHVTGIVRDHPEFIWATFEHVDNAPDCADTPTSGTNPATNRAWSLYRADTPAGSNNQFDEDNLLASVSVCRQHPWGGGNEQNQDNIKSLNASVRGHLEQHRPLWTNYQLVGGIWTTGNDAIPLNNGAPDSIQIGSLVLANTSMETFTQDDNCFACHNSGRHIVAVGNTPQTIGRKHLNLSHYVVNYQATQQYRVSR